MLGDVEAFLHVAKLLWVLSGGAQSMEGEEEPEHGALHPLSTSVLIYLF